MNKLAQIKLSPDEGFSGFGKLGQGGESSIFTFTQFISSAIGLISLVAVIWFLFVLTTGALGILASGGEKAANEAAKKKISSGLIGLIITIFALVMVNFIGSLLGIGDLLDIPRMFSTLIIK